MSNKPTIWALKIQPNSASDDAVPYEFCKHQTPQIIGTGWGLNTSYSSKKAALEAHRERGYTDQHGNVRFSIRAMVKKASIGDYVWVNEGSEYALCRIESDWKQHPNTAEDEWTQNDIHNYREATWKVVNPALVPGYVKRYFANPRGRPMARPNGGKSQSAKRYAEKLFSEKSTESTDIVNFEEVSNLVGGSSVSEVFDLLDPVETEDLAIDYLQSKGWHIVKSSTSRSQPGIECELRRVNREPQTGYVQVKSGETSVDVEEYQTLANNGVVFIHQFEKPSQVLPDGIHWISPNELREYIISHPGYLPSPTAYKLKLGLNTDSEQI